MLQYKAYSLLVTDLVAAFVLFIFMLVLLCFCVATVSRWKKDLCISYIHFRGYVRGRSGGGDECPVTDVHGTVVSLRPTACGRRLCRHRTAPLHRRLGVWLWRPLAARPAPTDYPLINRDWWHLVTSSPTLPATTFRSPSEAFIRTDFRFLMSVGLSK